MKRRYVWFLFLGILLAGCSKVAQTESDILAWGNAFNLHLTSGGGLGLGDYSFPHKLSDIDADLRAGLSQTDAWGKDFFYRRVRDDLYNLISAGPDGAFGNEDDIVMENGMLYDPMKIYGKHPLKKR